jgi:hypothetical protein
LAKNDLSFNCYQHILYYFLSAKNDRSFNRYNI